MIIDLDRFIAEERKVWDELELVIKKIERDSKLHMDLHELRRFHYLYQRASADLSKLATFAAQRELYRYLEQLVARAYSEIHRTRERGGRLHPLDWFFKTFPQTFRRQIRAFRIAVFATIAGCLFGGMALYFDPGAKPILVGPFSHLLQSPSQRVKEEEQSKTDRLAGHKAYFSTSLMTHNTRVSLLTFALGLTYGVGTLAMLFYNGVMLGAISVDYVSDGQAPFLVGWLLPHGSFEIPAIMIAGQAGLLLAGALIGRGSGLPLHRRVSALAPDLMTLLGGAALMLVWAGIVESFFSQYHEPVIPYAVKIAFGATELVLLTLFLTFSGRGAAAEKAVAAQPRPQAAIAQGPGS